MNQFFCLAFRRSKQIIQGLLAGYTDIFLLIEYKFVGRRLQIKQITAVVWVLP